MSDATNARARLLAFAQRIADARGLLPTDMRRLSADVVRLRSGYLRGGEWRATAHITGAAVHIFGHSQASTCDGDAGVYAHGSTPSAAVDEAINEWRRAMAGHLATVEREARAVAKNAENWRRIVDAIAREP